jgi:hypothetical protein
VGVAGDGADLIPGTRAVQVQFSVPREELAEFLRRLRTLSEGLKIVAQLERQLVDEEPATESPEQPASMLMLPAPMGHLKGKLRNPG